MTNGAHVSWDRFDATIQALTRRTEVLEHQAESLRGAETEHEAMEARIAALEHAGHEETEHERGRRDRAWVIGLAIVTGLVMPILTTAVVAFLHLRSVH